LHWNVQNNWSSIIFSDETDIMLGRNGKVCVWRKPDERFRLDCRAVCQKSAWQQPAKDYRLKPKYIYRYSCYHQ
jgi:hypothetical protein